MYPFPILIMPAFFALLEIFCLADAGLRFLRPWKRNRRLRNYLRQTAPTVSRNPKTRLILLPDHVLVLTDSRTTEPGIVRCEHTELKVAWSSVQTIEVAGGHLFLLCTPEKGGIILPRGAFPDEQAFRCFVDTAKAYRSDALLAPAPSQAMNAAPVERLHPAGPP